MLSILTLSSHISIASNSSSPNMAAVTSSIGSKSSSCAPSANSGSILLLPLSVASIFPMDALTASIPTKSLMSPFLFLSNVKSMSTQVLIINFPYIIYTLSAVGDPSTKTPSNEDPVVTSSTLAAGIPSISRVVVVAIMVSVWPQVAVTVSPCLAMPFPSTVEKPDPVVISPVTDIGLL